MTSNDLIFHHHEFAMARGYWHKGKSGEGVGQLRYLLYREDTPGIWPLKNYDNCS